MSTDASPHSAPGHETWHRDGILPIEQETAWRRIAYLSRDKPPSNATVGVGLLEHAQQGAPRVVRATIGRPLQGPRPVE